MQLIDELKNRKTTTEWQENHVTVYENNNPTKFAFVRHLSDEEHLAGDEVILPTESNFCRRLTLENMARSLKKMIKM